MKKGSKIAFISCLLIAALAIGYAAYFFTTKSMASDVYAKMQQQVSAQTPSPIAATPAATPAPTAAGSPGETQAPVETQKPAETPKPTATPKPTPTPEPYVSPIDFDALWEINEDIVAWLTIPGTNVNYPILQHTYENDYYLNVTAEGHEGLPGSIYIATYTDPFFKNNHISVIYGHNMIDGSMFGSLNNYSYESFMKEHDVVKIYTPKNEWTYRIFAGVIYDDRLIPVNYDDTWEPDREAFLDSLSEIGGAGTYIRDDLEVTSEDHLIVLSTCIAGRNANRYLVVAVRQDAEE